MQKHGVQILGQMKPEYSSVLTPEAVAFIGHIQRKFGSRVLDLLQKRRASGKVRYDAPQCIALHVVKWLKEACGLQI